MKKGLLFLMLLFISIATSFSQDIISLKDGKRVEGIVTEITPTLVRYKLFSNPNGRAYFTYKEDIAGIMYRDGKVETFNQPDGQSVSSNPNVSERQQSVETFNQSNGQLTKSSPKESENQQSSSFYNNQKKSKTQNQSVSNWNRTGDLKTVVGISPFRAWNAVRIKYERVFTPKFTVGGVLTGYYNSIYPGGQLAPIARFYFKEKAPEGFYAQAKAVGGYHQITYNVPHNKEIKQSFTSFGGGIAAGYQLLWGKENRWSVDINLGVKRVGNIPEPPKEVDDDFGFGYFFDNVGWYTGGPGSILDGLISVGYRF